MSKIEEQILKANHNCLEYAYVYLQLYVKDRRTNSESKSQQMSAQLAIDFSCMSKIEEQILKANHNIERITGCIGGLYVKDRRTNSESKSQR